MKYELVKEIKGILVLALGLLLLASYVSYVPQDLPWFTSHPNNPPHNLIRITGAYIAGVSFFVFGYSAYCVVALLLFWSWNIFTSQEMEFTWSKLISLIVLICVTSALLSLTAPTAAAEKFSRAGIVGLVFSDFLVRYLGVIGAYIVCMSLGALALVLTGEFLVSPLMIKLAEVITDAFHYLRENIKNLPQKITFPEFKLPKAPVKSTKRKALPAQDEEEEEEEEYEDDEEEYEDDEEEEEDEEYEDDEEEYEDDEDEDDEEYEDEDEEYEDEDEEEGSPNIRIVKGKKRSAAVDKPKRVGKYVLPSLDLLADPPEVSGKEVENQLVSGAKILESTLVDFGVQGKVVDIERGPVITRYEVQPGPGVKVQKFTQLSDDIALAMKATSVRIMAPIPGKNRVGIEVPNGSSAAVFLKEVLQDGKVRSSGKKLMMGIGKDISGESMVADLSEMPHMLIAGTTGAGKSVCINSLIMSVLLNATPDEVKLLLIDPKMVELAHFNGLPHCLCPAVTDPKKVSAALNWVVGEMEARYKAFSEAKVRNIQGYNAKGKKLPYIMVVVDELADLMQVSAKTIEGSIVRIAQLARAAGIHLIIATQRPSVNVITGTIKANFSARISFKVATKIDSRTVLDMNGAETLLGRGDLLFMKPGVAKPIRGQCSFVSDEEIHQVVNYIKEQGGDPEYDESILKRGSGAAGGAQDKDDLFDEAARLIIGSGQASVSILQRRMRLGYTRAARIIDQMEQEGLVGPYAGSKAREITVDREQWLLDNPAED